MESGLMILDIPYTTEKLNSIKQRTKNLFIFAVKMSSFYIQSSIFKETIRIITSLSHVFKLQRMID